MALGATTQADTRAAAEAPEVPRIGVLLPQILASSGEVGLREGLCR
jgi:hypothetical protein